eukprot:scaffold768_cov166-Amphora_coffeaeformis.AAC.16
MSNTAKRQEVKGVDIDRSHMILFRKKAHFLNEHAGRAMTKTNRRNITNNQPLLIVLTMASSTTSNTDTHHAYPEEDDITVKKLSQHLSDVNTNFCDHLSQQLKEVFASTVTDFPRLEQPEVLLKRLEKSYMRNVDIVEVYAARNIFTLDNLPPNRRVRIAQLFEEMNQNTTKTIALQLKEPEHNLTDNEAEENAMIDWEKLKSATAPTTSDQVEEKRRAVQALETKLAEARQRKALLERRVQELEVARQMTTWPTEVTANQVHESVSALMMGVHGVEDCQEQGEAALQQVKKRNLETEDDDDDTDGLTWNPLSPHVQNVQELYEKERKRINATTKDLQQMHEMLVKNKETNGKK